MGVSIEMAAARRVGGFPFWLPFKTNGRTGIPKDQLLFWLFTWQLANFIFVAADLRDRFGSLSHYTMVPLRQATETGAQVSCFLPCCNRVLIQALKSGSRKSSETSPFSLNKGSTDCWFIQGRQANETSLKALQDSFLQRHWVCAWRYGTCKLSSMYVWPTHLKMVLNTVAHKRIANGRENKTNKNSTHEPWSKLWGFR